MEGQDGALELEIPSPPDFQAILNQSDDILGTWTDEDDGAGSDGYSDYSEMGDIPEFGVPLLPTVPVPSPSPPSDPTLPIITNTRSLASHAQNHEIPVLSTKSKKTPDPKRSAIARQREQRKREERATEAGRAQKQKQNQRKTSLQDRIAKNHVGIKLVIKKLEALKIPMGELICYFFNPENKCDRFREFWDNKEYFEEMMACITTRKNATPTGQHTVHRWAIDHVKRTVRSEAQDITTSRSLQSRHLPINKDFFLGFRLEDMEAKLVKHCPIMLEVVSWFATSRAQERATEKAIGTKLVTKPHRQKVVATALLSLLREYNQYNNRFQQVLAGMMYTSGLKRQCFSILSRLGIIVTYTSLVRTTPRPRRKKLTEGEAEDQVLEVAESEQQRRLGLLVELSLSLQDDAREHAAQSAVAVTYDNVNFTSRVGEQTMGHTDKQENGTCATLYTVPGVAKEDLDADKYWEQLLSASPLELDDIALTPKEHLLEQESLVRTILGILVEHGGEFFARYKKLFDHELPNPTPVGPYEICPLPAMNVNESSVDGNIDVYEKIIEQLSEPGKSFAPGCTKIFLGDQLSMAHLRKAVTWRIGNEDAVSSMAEAVTGGGLFHVEMTIATLLLENFWGLPSSEANPASLWAHNTLLGRKKIVLTSLPPFRNVLDLLTVSLYGRVLCTLPLAARAADLESYTHTLSQFDGPQPKNYKKSWEQLKRDVQKQISLFANRKVAFRLRREREQDSAPANTNPAPAGDMVFESGVLFFDMSLRLKNFVEAIRSGNSDRVVAILKTFALAFRGTRHTKYAYEMVVFLHNYLHVWPIPLRNAVMKAWLVNISGKPNAFKPADLMQEHLNLQIKTIYKAHGSNESWEWLSMISPCVHVLRQIAHEFHTALGDRQGMKHSSVSIEDDVRALVSSLNENQVYEVVPGRAFDPEDSPPKDVISEGYRRLAHGSKGTIDHYNEYFKDLQRRLKISPVSSLVPQPVSDEAPAPDPGASDANRADRAVDGAEDTLSTDKGAGAPEVDEGEGEENVDALVDWDQAWMEEEDIIGIGFSDEEFLDDESDSDDELWNILDLDS